MVGATGTSDNLDQARYAGIVYHAGKLYAHGLIVDAATGKAPERIPCGLDLNDLATGYEVFMQTPIVTVASGCVLPAGLWCVTI